MIGLSLSLTRAGVANSLPRPTKFVSKTATNGFAVGTDSGTGASRSAPWLSVDYALAHAVDGDVIEVNDGTYQSATFYGMNFKNMTLMTYRAGSVILQAADGQTRIINVNGGGVPTLATLINVTLDGRGNTTRGITVSSGSSAAAGFFLRNVKITGVTQSYLDAVPDHANITINGLTCDGTVSARPVYLQAKDGSITVNGVTFDGVAITGASLSAIDIWRLTGGTGGLAVNVRGVRGTVTGPASQSTNGIVVMNTDDAVIESNNLTIQGGNLGALYQVWSNSATMTANRATVRNNTGSNLHDGGYGVLIGSDGSSAGNNNHNDALVENNNLACNAASAQPIHGYMLGFGTGGTVRNNTITGAGHALIAKDQTGGTFSGNTADGFTYDGLYAKGSTGTVFSGNTLNVTHALVSAAMYAASDSVSLANSTSVQFNGNTVNYTTAGQVIDNVAASNDATFSGNTYNISAALPATPWNYQGTGYATLAAWKAAHEPDALP